MKSIRALQVAAITILSLASSGCFKSAADDIQPTSFPVTTKASHGGSVEPKRLSVEIGSTASINIIPELGYVIDRVMGCAGSMHGDVYVTGPINEACTVTAEFTSAVGRIHQVKSRAASGTTRGDISPSQISVPLGERGHFYVTHNPGYVPVVTGCDGELINDVYSTSSIAGDCLVEAVFEPISGDLALITATASYGGTIEPERLSVPVGESASFFVTQGRGYTADVTGCNGILENGAYTIETVTQDCVIDAQFLNFVPDSFLVSAQIEEGGTITPSFASVQDGDFIIFVIDTEIDRKVKEVQGCPGTYYPEMGVYITSAIAKDCDVDVLLEPSTPPSFHVGINVEGFGTASPGQAHVQQGSHAQFVITPDIGYRAVKGEGCAGSLNGNIYTTGPVSKECLIRVVIEDTLANTYDITSNALANGSISPRIVQAAQGSRTGFVATPDPGYAVQSIYGCGGTQDGNTFTTGIIHGPCTVTARFQEVYTVTAMINGGGYVLPEKVEVLPGGSARFTYYADEGHYIDNNFSPQSTCNRYPIHESDWDEPVQTYRIDGIWRDCTITAFLPGASVIKAVARGDGTGQVSPESINPIGDGVHHFTFTPSSDSYLYSVDGCNQIGQEPTLGPVYTYRVWSSNRSCAMQVTFRKKDPSRPPPTNLRLTPNGTGRIDFSFEPVDGATGYNVYIGYQSPPTHTRYNTRWTNNNGGWFYNMSPGAEMFFMMTAYYGSHPDELESGPSDVVSAIVPY